MLSQLYCVRCSILWFEVMDGAGNLSICCIGAYIFCILFKLWVLRSLFIYLLIYLFCLFRGAHMAHGGSQVRGLNGAVAAGLRQSHSNVGSATHTTAHSNSGSLTHQARPGIEPTTSWFLVRFVNHCATTGTPKIKFLLTKRVGC